MKKSIKYWVFICVIFASTIFLCFKQLKQDNWNRCISSDGKGYYAYLPALFIYHDLNFKFVDQYESKYYRTENKVDFTNTIKGAEVNKYWMGTSLLMSPFFFATHFMVTMFHFPNDGYSFTYQVMIAVAACFYLLLGLFYIRKLLLLYNCNEIEITVVLFSLVFATNLFYYTVAEPSMSHVYSMATISAFVFYIKSYFETFNQKYLHFAILILGIIILIRPSNIIVVGAMPFLAGSLNNLKLALKRIKFTHTIPYVFIAMIVVSLQMFYYKSVAGSYFIYSYGNEKFNLLDPHFMDFLFSYRKGLFVYAPILLLSMLGLIFISRQSIYLSFSLFIFIFFVIYILSSWWMWFYGGGFGMRPMIDYFVFFAILLAIAISSFKQKKATRILGGIILTACVLVAQIQTYQKVNFILPWDGINKEIYWKIFLKTDPALIGKYTSP